MFAREKRGRERASPNLHIRDLESLRLWPSSVIVVVEVEQTGGPGAGRVERKERGGRERGCHSTSASRIAFASQWERHCQVQVPRVNASACVEAVRCSAGSKARAAQVDDAVPRTSRLPGATQIWERHRVCPFSSLSCTSLSSRGVVQMESDHTTANTLPTHSFVGSSARAVVQARCKNESTAYPSTDIETAVRAVLLQQPCALRAQHSE
jgi:hypothetical protein